MTITSQDLKHLAKLAYLAVEPGSQEQLAQEINDIMDFVDQLSSVNTGSIQPLCHPLALHQRLRADEITEENCLAQLEELAPLFQDQLYLVPKVIDSGN